MFQIFFFYLSSEPVSGANGNMMMILYRAAEILYYTRNFTVLYPKGFSSNSTAKTEHVQSNLYSNVVYIEPIDQIILYITISQPTKCVDA